MSTTNQAVVGWMRQRELSTVFGGPGAPRAFPRDFRYILGLQEAVVVGMADGYASVTGRPALVDLPAGSGNAMGAILGAAANRTPLILTAGQRLTTMLSMESLLTDPAAASLPGPAVKWSYEPPRPQDVPAALEWAYHVALTPPRGPVFLSLPTDGLANPAADPAPPVRTVAAAAAPDPIALASLAGRLDRARSPVLVVGADVDASGGWAAAVELAERCALPVWEAPLECRVSFPQTHPHYRGTLLPGGESARQLAGHDLVIVAGACPLQGPPSVLLTSDPACAPFGDVIVGDVRQALSALAELTKVKEEPLPGSWPAPAPSPRGCRPMSPVTALAALAAGAPPDTIWVNESPSTRPAFRDQIRVDRPGSCLFSAGGGTGYGLPAAIGAQLGQPSRPVVAVIGDGSTQYAIPALWSAAAYRVPLTIVVLADREHAMMRWFRQFDGAAAAPGLDVDICAIAKGYGVAASHVESSDALATAVRIATASDLPMLIEVPVNGP